MALTTPYQANDFPGDPFVHPIQHQPHNHALDAWVSLRRRDILPFTDVHSSMSIPPQVPHAPANGQHEGHQEDIPLPDAGPQGLHHFNVAYHPQPLVGVSNSHPPAAKPAFD